MTRKTVIITGITYRCTERLVHDLRRHCDDDTHIIVSTWEGQEIDVSDVESCKVIFTKDPGPGPKSKKHNGGRHGIQNFNRQLFSVIAGLDFIEETYGPEDRGIVLRIRSDFQCCKNPFDIYFDIPVTDKEISTLSNKVWIDNRHPCRDGKMSRQQDYGLSDFTCMGRYEDVREWHNIKEESIRIAPIVKDCEHIFVVSNVVKCETSKKDKSIMDEKSQTAKRFLDENIVFYAKDVDLGMICTKYSRYRLFLESVAPKKPDEENL